MWSFKEYMREHNMTLSLILMTAYFVVKEFGHLIPPWSEVVEVWYASLQLIADSAQDFYNTSTLLSCLFIMIPSLLYNLFTTYQSYLDWVKTLIKRSSRSFKPVYAEKVYQHGVVGQGICPESMRSTPILNTEEWPQGALFVISDSQGVLGSAVRLDDYLLTPQHVAMLDDIRFVGPNSSIHVGYCGQPAPLAHEMIAYKLTASEWSKLGVRSASVSKVPVKGRVQATLYGARENQAFRYSHGEITPGQVMGSLEYSGSSLPGFSGGLYTVGKRVLGVHRHGGYVNGGVSLRYLQLLLQAQRPESTTDFLDSIMNPSHKTPIRVQRQPGWYIVEDGGEFHMIEDDAYEEWYAQGWEGRGRKILWDGEPDYSRQEPESFLPETTATGTTVPAYEDLPNPVTTADSDEGLTERASKDSDLNSEAPALTGAVREALEKMDTNQIALYKKAWVILLDDPLLNARANLVLSIVKAYVKENRAPAPDSSRLARGLSTLADKLATVKIAGRIPSSKQVSEMAKVIAGQLQQDTQ